MIRLPSHRSWSAFAAMAMMIAAAPALVISQSGGADGPWDSPWIEPWPALLDRPASADSELAALQQRIDAALLRLEKSDGDIKPTVASLGSDADQRVEP